eukprot:TRINITY_DN7663_c0_g1_i2.p1 TRINITY_DN7663_c0_g1~~TRINITY_DN7663_c0_g1_i2.p1  ORF type:complete len:147 (+),score=44.89 TRINITY_DN7663_c0_g1_i2:141-581(+)
MDQFLSSRATRYVPIEKKRQKNADLKVRARYNKTKKRQEGAAPEQQVKKTPPAPEEHIEQPKKRQKRAKVDPLAKVSKAATTQGAVVREQKIDKEEQIRAHKAKLRKNRMQKKETTNKLNRRTKWGQPIMKHHMDNILQKLQSEAK